MTSRCLRVGVLLGDRLVEERLFDGATPITLGQSLRCSISLPVDGLPSDHVLFARDQGRWVLKPAPAMTGRLGHADQVTAIEAGREVALEQGSRGKLTIGEATILFQDIARPPVAPRPQLPASVRGSFADRVDRKLAVIIGGSLVLHIGIAAWAWATDREQPSMLESKIEPTYSQETYVVTLPDEPTPVPTATPSPAPTAPAPGVAAPASPRTQTPHRIVQPVHPAVPDRPVDPAQLAQMLAQGVTGDGQPGDMSSRHPGSKLDKQLEELNRNKKQVTVGNGATDPTHIGETPKRQIVGDPTLEQTQHTDQYERPIRVKLEPVRTDDPTTLTPDAVLDKINGSYMKRLQRCYQQELVNDPTLSGKISLEFTVDDHGKVIDPEASGMTHQLDACVRSYMGSWRFGIPRDRQNQPTEATYHVTLALQPT